MDRVQAACEACFDEFKGDCSGFVKAVGSRLNVAIQGVANDIVNQLRQGGAWTRLADGPAALASAQAGKLVVAGLRGDEQHEPSNHGHIVVIVNGPLARGRYPTAYWGSLGGTPRKDETLNWAWTPEDRDRITYAAHAIPPG